MDLNQCNPKDYLKILKKIEQMGLVICYRLVLTIIPSAMKTAALSSRKLPATTESYLSVNNVNII